MKGNPAKPTHPPLLSSLKNAGQTRARGSQKAKAAGTMKYLQTVYSCQLIEKIRKQGSSSHR